MLKIGFLLNPVAGIGGPIAMKGSDDLTGEVLKEHAGYSRQRSESFFKVLFELHPDVLSQIDWVAPRGEMGGDVLHGFELNHISLNVSSRPTTRQDTVDCIRSFRRENCDLIVFGGGDGTARDVLTGLNTDMTTPVIGLPCGVKMHSGVFSVTPEAAAKMIEAIVSGEMVDLDEAEVRDYVESSGIKTKYYGEMSVPKNGRYLQHTKIGGKESEELAVQEISAHIEEEFSSANLLIGPGSTCRQIKDRLGLSADQSTLLGFDLYVNGMPWVIDLSATDIKDRLGRIDFVIISFTRRQGFLLGRGNQQLDAGILSALSWSDQFVVVGSRQKLSSLEGNPLLIDTGKVEVNRRLAGMTEILTGFRDKVLHRVDFELS